jgi:hypothetical protein
MAAKADRIIVFLHPFKESKLRILNLESASNSKGLNY